MKIDLGKAVNNAFGYAFMKDRFAFYFVYMLVYMSALGYPMYNMFKAIRVEDTGMIVSSALIFVAILIVFLFITAWVNLAYVHGYQTRKKKGSLKKAFIEVKKYYWRMLAVLLVVGVISGILSSVPYVGWIISIIIGWIFLFVTQFVVIGGKKFEQVFSSSWKNFRKYTWETILAWVVDALIVLGILIVCMIPGIVYVFRTAFTYMEASNFSGAYSAITAQPLVLGITMLVALAGFAFASVFSIGMITDVFMQIYKKK